MHAAIGAYNPQTASVIQGWTKDDLSTKFDTLYHGSGNFCSSVKLSHWFVFIALALRQYSVIGRCLMLKILVFFFRHHKVPTKFINDDNSQSTVFN